MRDVEYDSGVMHIYRIYYQNGDIYEGEVENDMKEGSGVYYY